MFLLFSQTFVPLFRELCCSPQDELCLQLWVTGNVGLYYLLDQEIHNMLLLRVAAFVSSAYNQGLVKQSVRVLSVGTLKVFNNIIT